MKLAVLLWTCEAEPKGDANVSGFLKKRKKKKTLVITKSLDSLIRKVENIFQVKLLTLYLFIFINFISLLLQCLIWSLLFIQLNLVILLIKSSIRSFNFQNLFKFDSFCSFNETNTIRTYDQLHNKVVIKVIVLINTIIINNKIIQLKWIKLK